MACKLALPPTSKIHLVFHVSLIKKKLGQATLAHPTLSSIIDVGVMDPQPEAILDRRLVKYRGRLGVMGVIS